MLFLYGDQVALLYFLTCYTCCALCWCCCVQRSNINTEHSPNTNKYKWYLF